MMYESLLLFGVVFMSGWLFSTLLQQRHALHLRTAFQEWLFLVIGIYFVWFWSHGGQTLAMKTWRLRLVTIGGLPVNAWRATLRYLLAWLWILPGLGLAWTLNAKGWMLILVPLANMALWSLTIYLDSGRQFLHDRLAGTRLVMVPVIAPRPIDGRGTPNPPAQ